MMIIQPIKKRITHSIQLNSSIDRSEQETAVAMNGLVFLQQLENYAVHQRERQRVASIEKVFHFSGAGIFSVPALRI